MNKYFYSQSYWLLILHRNCKGFLVSTVYKHLKGIFGYRAPNWRKSATRRHIFFFQNKPVSRISIGTCCIVNKGKTAKQWMDKYGSYFIWALYSVTCTHSFSADLVDCLVLLVDLFKQRFINSLLHICITSVDFI